MLAVYCRLPLPRPAFRVWSQSCAGPAPQMRRAHAVMSGRFELHPAWNMESPERRVSGSSAENAVRMWQRWVPQDTREPVMGVGKKAKRDAKAVKGKTKKGAGKVKHKGKKAKNAAKH